MSIFIITMFELCRYYSQMTRVAIFLSEAIGYALFSDSAARDLVLGVIEMQQKTFLSLIIPYLACK